MRRFLLLVFSYGLYTAFQPVSDVASSGHRPLGHVLYEQYTYLPCEQHLNGPASLWFNHYEAVYVHDAVLAETAVETQGNKILATPGDEEGFPVYINIKDDVLIFKDFVGLSFVASIIRDSLPKIDWHILDEYRQIGGYSCQKAEGEFAGRLYEAWFSKDIPIPFGPYKLWGLPGLILEAKTDDESVQFLFKGLEMSDKLEGEVFVPSKGKNSFNSYEAYLEACEKRKMEMLQEARAKGHLGFSITDAPWDCKIEIRE